MKTTILFITTLIAVTGFSLTACTNPLDGGNEHEHTWGTPVSVLHDEVITFPENEWEPNPDSIADGEPNGPRDGIARRYGTGITTQTDTYICQDCGETKEEIVTVGTPRTYDFTKLHDDPANVGLIDEKILYSYQVIQDGKIVDRNTLEWNAWADTADPVTDWLDKQEIDSGDYNNIVDTDGNPFTPGTSHQYKLQKQERTHKTDSGRTETRWVKVNEREIAKEISDRTPGVADINTLAIMGHVNVGDKDTFWAEGTVETLLGALSKQAAQLEAFFADSSNKFDALQTAEGEIKDKVANTTPEGYLGYVADRESMLFDLIGENINGTSEFNTLWNGYKAGHYLITRDWQTEMGGNIDYDPTAEYDKGNVAKYLAAAAAAHITVSGKFTGRGINIPGIGLNPAGILQNIETALVTASATAFKAAHTINGNTHDTQIEAMFRALIIQFGQDNVEFKAFFDDIKKAGLSAAIEIYMVNPAAPQ